jgi:hypothetical protein
MRKMILLVFGLLLLVSCGKKEASSRAVRWTGWELPAQKAPLCIIWYKLGETGWQTHRVISSGEDMRMVMRAAAQVDRESPSYGGDQKLSLLFYDGSPESLQVVDVFFRMAGDRIEGPLGCSDSLGKVLVRVEESRPSIMPQQDGAVLPFQAGRELAEALHRKAAEPGLGK